MSLKREFEIFMDRDYPSWRKDKRLTTKCQIELMRRAFIAGFKVGEEGPTVAALREVTGRGVNIFSLPTAKKSTFKPK